MPMHPLLAMLSEEGRKRIGITQEEIDDQDMVVHITRDARTRHTAFDCPDRLFELAEFMCAFDDGLGELWSWRQATLRVTAQGEPEMSIEGVMLEPSAQMFSLGSSLLGLLASTLGRLKVVCRQLPDAELFTQRVRDTCAERVKRALGDGYTDLHAAYWLLLPVLERGDCKGVAPVQLLDISIPAELDASQGYVEDLDRHVYLVPILVPTELTDKSCAVPRAIYGAIGKHLLQQIVPEVLAEAGVITSNMR